MDGVPAPVAGGESIGTSSPALNFLRSLDPTNIDFIEVLKDGSASNYGVRGGNGVILINTSRKHRNMRLNENNMQTFYSSGVAKPMPFPELNHEKKK
jgi:TonB-dependent SusC/RagA subfamily outer membrane receptor